MVFLSGPFSTSMLVPGSVVPAFWGTTQNRAVKAKFEREQADAASKAPEHKVSAMVEIPSSHSFHFAPEPMGGPRRSEST